MAVYLASAQVWRHPVPGYTTSPCCVELSGGQTGRVCTGTRPPPLEHLLIPGAVQVPSPGLCIPHFSPPRLPCTTSSGIFPELLARLSCAPLGPCRVLHAVTLWRVPCGFAPSPPDPELLEDKDSVSPPPPRRCRHVVGRQCWIFEWVND